MCQVVCFAAGCDIVFYNAADKIHRTPADRLILIVADGLRADRFFELDEVRPKFVICTLYDVELLTRLSMTV